MDLLKFFRPKPKALPRGDGWQNMATGLGYAPMDKTTQTSFVRGQYLRDEEITGLINGDDMAARIVSALPEEMFRAGYEILADKAKELKDAASALDLDGNLLEAYRWGRAYGGALLIMGLDDGRAPDRPLDPEAVRGLKYLHVVDRRHAHVNTYYRDLGQPKFGKPETYRVTPLSGGHGAPSVVIHETRVIRFDGAPTDRETVLERAGWSLSVLQAPYEVLKQFAQGYQSAGYLLSDASQSVFKLAGLMEQIANDPETLQKRMQILEYQRSVARGIMLDADYNEDFDRKPTQFGGIPELLDRLQQRLAAAAKQPVSILMGRSPAGMNATGESDFRSWYGDVESKQANELKPKHLHVYRLIARTLGQDPEGVDIAYTPLVSLTPAEQAALEEVLARRDQTYLNAGVLLPEEVTILRFGQGKAFSTRALFRDDWLKAREESLKDEARLADAFTTQDPNAATDPQGTNPDPEADPEAKADPAPPPGKKAGPPEDG